jgi:tetratricopeptide (TPR) repeat protein
MSFKNVFHLPVKPWKASTFQGTLQLFLPLLLMMVMVFSSVVCWGVTVHDPIHDTPLSRKRYRMEILGFGTELTPVTAADTAGNMAEGIWLTRQRYRDLGEREKADAQLEALINWRQAQGRENLVPYAALLIREAFRAMEEDDISRAQELSRFAVRMAPGYPPVHMAAGYLSFKANRFNLPAFIVGWYRSMRATVDDAYHLLVFLGAVTVTLLITGILISLIWGVSVILRYSVYLIHDLEEFFGRRFHPKMRRTAALLVFLLPLLTLTTPLWLVGLAVAVTWTYQRGRERFVSLLVLLLLGLLPLFTWTVTSSLVFMEDELTRAMMAVRSGSEEPEHGKVLEEYRAADPGDGSLNFSLALYYMRTGDHEKAEELFQAQLEDRGPLEFEAIMNLGAIQAGRGDLESAEETYRQAVEFRPDSAAAHYNLAQVLNLQFNFGEGERELKKALSLDKTLVSERPSAKGDGSGQLLVGQGLPTSAFLSRITDFRDSRPVRETGRHLWKIFVSGVSPRVFPIFLAGLVILGVVIQVRLQKRGLARRCSKCGRPYCPVCLPGAAKTKLCPQCQHIFLVKEGVESAMRVEKMMEVNSYQKGRFRLAFFTSVLLPGSGHIYLGYPLWGIMFASVSALLLVAVMGWQAPFADLSHLLFPWSRMVWRLGLIALLTVYVINLTTVFRLGAREG